MTKVTNGLGLALSGNVEKIVFVQFNGEIYNSHYSQAYQVRSN